MIKDLINKQTFNNRYRKLKKIPSDSENGCFKSEYNLLVTETKFKDDTENSISLQSSDKM